LYFGYQFRHTTVLYDADIMFTYFPYNSGLRQSSIVTRYYPVYNN